MLIVLSVLQVVRLVFNNVLCVGDVEPGRLLRVDLRSVDPRLHLDHAIILLQPDARTVREHHDLVVAEILLLLLLVRDAAFRDGIVGRAKLGMHVVAGDDYKFEPLVHGLI